MSTGAVLARIAACALLPSGDETVMVNGAVWHHDFIAQTLPLDDSANSNVSVIRCPFCSNSLHETAAVVLRVAQSVGVPVKLYTCRGPVFESLLSVGPIFCLNCSIFYSALSDKCRRKQFITQKSLYSRTMRFVIKSIDISIYFLDTVKGYFSFQG